VFAVFVAKSIKNGDRRKDILQGVRKIQDEMMCVDCSKCGSRYPPRIITETRARRFYHRALSVPYAEFLAEVENHFDRLESTCPICGVTSILVFRCPDD